MSAATLTIEERAHLVEAEHRDSTRGAEAHRPLYYLLTLID
jgi:hypothetical protein